MTRVVTLQELHHAGLLGPLDEQFARTLGRVAGEDRPEVLLAAALASRRVSDGHVCLDLPLLCRSRPAYADAAAGELAWPELDAWLSALGTSPLVNHAGGVTPLVLDAAGRLYLHRYHDYEQRLASAVRTRLAAPPPRFAAQLLASGLSRYFPDSVEPSQLGLFAMLDKQREAARLAVERSFLVISGGPGTGKTHTVVKLLALLIEQRFAEQQSAPRTLLLAPTGKAAARLSESIVRARDALDAPDAVRAAIAAMATEARTIHSALGARPGGSFRHGRGAPLVADLVIIDEASMVDLALMTRLFDAVPEQARIILLGDQNQLASVEAGAVLGDLCGVGVEASAPPPAMAQAVVQLDRSYRYTADSGIGKLAEAINAGRGQEVIDLLESDRFPDVLRVDADPKRPLAAALETAVVEGFRDCLNAVQEDPVDPGAVLAAFERFRLLCAHRRGPHGVEIVNAHVEALLSRRGLLEPSAGFYPGRPVMVTRNDPHLRLFNGDVGVVLRRPRGLVVAIASSSSAEPRQISTASLPAHETVFAMSIHKSQGSELDEVAVVLPVEASPLLTRELLYTAVTRARRKVLIQGSRERVLEAVATRVERSSGLAEMLWRG